MTHRDRKVPKIPSLPKAEIEHDQWRLVHKATGTLVFMDTLQTTRHGTFKIIGGYPPRHTSSTGRIWVQRLGNGNKAQGTTELFPTVCNMKWVYTDTSPAA